MSKVNFELYYILDGKTPKPCPDPVAWTAWFVTNNRIVAEEHIDEAIVKTSFIAMDVNWGVGPPLLFQTDIYLPEMQHEVIEQHAHWAEAEISHREIVEALHIAKGVAGENYRLRICDVRDALDLIRWGRTK